ncbi:MAG: hypothetical protein GXO54_03570 [Chloroflexi bacterium]|nr:hypothetical protein [Chloroflexota bacterium]
MIAWLRWYFTLGFVAALALPWTWRIFRTLPTRGVFFARVLGWFGWGYAFWLAGVLGVTPITAGGAWSTLLSVAALSAWALRSPEHRRAFWHEMRARWRLLLLGEGLFALAFAGWAVVRAAHPDILGTEKPMELAFINAILRSPRFPPHDPWLAGYAIAYYYFGYVLTALLALATGTPGPVAFNLGVATIFGLAVAGAYGVVFDLLARDGAQAPRSVYFAAGLGPIFAFLVGNWEGFLEILHRKRVFWQATAVGWRSTFWHWLAIQNLEEPPLADPSGWMPPRYWWWWRASRVIRDTNLAGGHQEVIDEFPFFSFILGDLHPHVLALPFVLLAVGLALVLFHLVRRRAPEALAPEAWLTHPLAQARAFVRAVFEDTPWWIWPWVLGGLAFLNAWDFPLALALNTAAFGLALVWRGWPWRWAAGFAAMWGMVTALFGALLYVPYSWSFDSQARGLLPNVVNPSRGAQLWVMFGPLWVPLFAWLGIAAWQAWRAGRGRVWRQALAITLGLVLALWLASWLQAAAIVAVLPWLSPRGEAAAQAYLSTYAARDFTHLIRAGLRRQVLAWAGTGFLAGLFALALGYAWDALRRARAHSSGSASTDPRTAFVALLVAWGAFLVLFPNFFYLWDHFGTRMNTVFKFYYQAWVLWALAAAYATWHLRAVAARAAVVLGLMLGLVYTGFGLADRLNSPRETWTLDGSAWLQRSAPDTWAAIQAIQAMPLGVVLEADGGSYSEYARISTYTGYPTILGWLGHESQWRGGTEEIGTRPEDIKRMYTSNHWDEVLTLLTRYRVRYVVVGPLELRRFPRAARQFEGRLPVLGRFGDTTVYVVDYEK